MVTLQENYLILSLVIKLLKYQSVLKKIITLPTIFFHSDIPLQTKKAPRQMIDIQRIVEEKKAFKFRDNIIFQKAHWSQIRNG